jgi:hypothetical protein
VLGTVPPGLAEPAAGPDPDRLAAELAAADPDGLDGVRRRMAAARTEGPWPVPLPPDLRRGLGAAQFAAALTELRRFLGPPERSVIADRPLDTAERRLTTDVPPHYGS